MTSSTALIKHQALAEQRTSEKIRRSMILVPPTPQDPDYTHTEREEGHHHPCQQDVHQLNTIHPLSEGRRMPHPSHPRDKTQLCGYCQQTPSTHLRHVWLEGDSPNTEPQLQSYRHALACSQLDSAHRLLNLIVAHMSTTRCRQEASIYRVTITSSAVTV